MGWTAYVPAYLGARQTEMAASGAGRRGEVHLVLGAHSDEDHMSKILQKYPNELRVFVDKSEARDYLTAPQFENAVNVKADFNKPYDMHQRIADALRERAEDATWRWRWVVNEFVQIPTNSNRFSVRQDEYVTIFDKVYFDWSVAKFLDWAWPLVGLNDFQAVFKLVKVDGEIYIPDFREDDPEFYKRNEKIHHKDYERLKRNDYYDQIPVKRPGPSIKGTSITVGTDEDGYLVRYIPTIMPYMQEFMANRGEIPGWRDRQYPIIDVSYHIGYTSTIVTEEGVYDENNGRLLRTKEVYATVRYPDIGLERFPHVINTDPDSPRYDMDVWRYVKITVKGWAAQVRKPPKYRHL